MTIQILISVLAFRLPTSSTPRTTTTTHTTTEPKTNPLSPGGAPAPGGVPAKPANSVQGAPAPGAVPAAGSVPAPGAGTVPKTPTTPPTTPPASGPACIIKRSLDGGLYKRCPTDGTDGGSAPSASGNQAPKRKQPDNTPQPMQPADNPNVQRKGSVSETDTLNNPEGLKAAHTQPGGTWGVNPNNPNQVIANKDGDIKKSGVDAAITKGATEGAGVPKIETSKEATAAEKKAALAKLQSQPSAKVEQQKVNSDRTEAGKPIVQPIPDKAKPLANMEDPPRQMGPNSNLPGSVFGVGPNQNSGYSGALEKTAMGKLGQTVDGNTITSVGVGHQNVGNSRAEQEMADRTKAKVQAGDETPTVLGGKMNDKGTYSDQESGDESAPKKPKQQRRDLLQFQIEAREVLDRVLKREAFKRSVAQKLARRDFLESMVPMVEVY